MNDGYLASFPLLLPFIQKDLDIQFSTIGMLTGLLNMAGIFLAMPAALGILEQGWGISLR